MVEWFKHASCGHHHPLILILMTMVMMMMTTTATLIILIILIILLIVVNAANVVNMLIMIVVMIMATMVTLVIMVITVIMVIMVIIVIIVIMVMVAFLHCERNVEPNICASKQDAASTEFLALQRVYICKGKRVGRCGGLMFTMFFAFSVLLYIYIYIYPNVSFTTILPVIVPEQPFTHGGCPKLWYPKTALTLCFPEPFAPFRAPAESGHGIMIRFSFIYRFLNSCIQTFREPYAALSRLFATAAKHTHPYLQTSLGY